MLSTFSILQSSKPVTEHIGESQTEVESLQIPISEQSQIPICVHDIFVWYVHETISEEIIDVV